MLRLDASYMLATAQTSPLDQTLRFTLTFDMDGIKEILDENKIRIMMIRTGMGYDVHRLTDNRDLILCGVKNTL